MISHDDARAGHDRQVDQPVVSARELCLLRRGELAELRNVGAVRLVGAGTVVAAAGAAPTHVQVVGDGELELMAGRTAAGPP